MLEQKEIIIDGKEFIIQKFPAVAGREIVTQYPISATPKLGDYQTNKEIMLKIMCYVGVKVPGNSVLWLRTEELVNNHTGSWETLMKIEYAAMEYNCSFLADGKLSSYLNGITQSLPDWITSMLIRLSESLSAKEKPVTKNSKKAIA